VLPEYFSHLQQGELADYSNIRLKERDPPDDKTNVLV
jgi:hypothetical protein